MDIYLDFDGTLVEHEYPKIGREVPHAMRVVKRLKDAGRRIILNTYRADISLEHLTKAFEWFTYHPRWDLVFDDVAKKKVQPYWKPETAFDVLFIDDQATGIPLIPAVMTQGKMVDWLAVEKILEEHKII